MLEALIALAMVAALTIISIRANHRFRERGRLPMQWSPSGKVYWTAPRRLALSFTPALAAIVLGGAVIAILLSGDPRPGQDGLGVPVILFIGMAFLAAHLLHLRLIR